LQILGKPLPVTNSWPRIRALYKN